MTKETLALILAAIAALLSVVGLTQSINNRNDAARVEARVNDLDPATSQNVKTAQFNQVVGGLVQELRGQLATMQTVDRQLAAAVNALRQPVVPVTAPEAEEAPTDE